MPLCGYRTSSKRQQQSGRMQVCISLSAAVLLVPCDCRQSTICPAPVTLVKLMCVGDSLPAGAVARLRRRAGIASCTTLSLSHSLQGDSQVAALQVCTPCSVSQSAVCVANICCLAENMLLSVFRDVAPLYTFSVFNRAVANSMKRP